MKLTKEWIKLKQGIIMFVKEAKKRKSVLI